MYQWKENRHEKRRTVTDASGKAVEETVTTYSYSPVWSSHRERTPHSLLHRNPPFPADLLQDDITKAGSGEANKSVALWNAVPWEGGRLRFGAAGLGLTCAMVAKLLAGKDAWQPLRLSDDVLTAPADELRPYGLVVSADRASLVASHDVDGDALPRVGDVRVRFRVAEEGVYTALGALARAATPEAVAEEQRWLQGDAASRKYADNAAAARARRDTALQAIAGPHIAPFVPADHCSGRPVSSVPQAASAPASSPDDFDALSDSDRYGDGSVGDGDKYGDSDDGSSNGSSSAKQQPAGLLTRIEQSLLASAPLEVALLRRGALGVDAAFAQVAQQDASRGDGWRAVGGAVNVLGAGLLATGMAPGRPRGVRLVAAIAMGAAVTAQVRQSARRASPAPAPLHASCATAASPALRHDDALAFPALQTISVARSQMGAEHQAARPRLAARDSEPEVLRVDHNELHDQASSSDEAYDDVSLDGSKAQIGTQSSGGGSV